MRGNGRGPGKWPLRRARSGWPFGYVRAWEVAGNSGYAAMASEARADLRTVSSLSWGRPGLEQAGVGVLGPGLRCSGRIARGDEGTVLGGMG